MSQSLQSISRNAMGEIRKWKPHFAYILHNRFPSESAEHIWSNIENDFRELLSVMPDPGFRAPTMRQFSIAGAIYIAVYRILKSKDLTPAQVWEICDEATKRRFSSMNRVEKWMASSAMFSRVMHWLTQSLHNLTQKQPNQTVGGWAVRYVQPEKGKFELGVDYTQCAIRDLAYRVNVPEFAPYICLADIAGSDAFGWGLTRTETLAQGGNRCDFRFHRHRPTDVKVRLPVL